MSSSIRSTSTSSNSKRNSLHTLQKSNSYISFENPKQDNEKQEGKWSGFIKKVKTSFTKQKDTVSAGSNIPEITEKNTKFDESLPVQNLNLNVSPGSIERNKSSLNIIRKMRGRRVDPHQLHQQSQQNYWMKDEKVKECYECNVSFSTFRRKHHCRICGQIFCHKCTILTSGGLGERRVCQYCEKLLQNYKKNDTSADEQITSKSSSFDFSGSPDTRRSVNAMVQRSEFRNSMQSLNSISELYLPDGIKKIFSIGSSRRNTFASEDIPFMNGQRAEDFYFDYQPDHADSEMLALQSDDEDDDSNSILTSFSGIGRSSTLFGPHEHESQVKTAEHSRLTRSNSVTVGMDEMLSEFPQPFTEDPWVYRTPHPQDPPGGAKKAKRSNSVQRRNSATSSTLRVNTKSAKKKFSKDKGKNRFSSQIPLRKSSSKTALKKIKNISSRVSDEEIRNILEFTFPSHFPITNEENECKEDLNITSPLNFAIPESPISKTFRFEKPLNTDLNSSSYEHLRKLLHQVLVEAQIKNIKEWHEVILKLLLEVSSNVSPNVKAGDEIDIRHYVKIKKLPGGVPSDSFYLHGVACSKSPVHKQFSKPIENPKILLLSFSIEYNRKENQFISLDSLRSQEKEHVGNITKRIINLKPDLVLIEKHISAVALHLFIENKITVVFNVKSSVIEAVARCTQADIVESIDKLTLPQEIKLGNCGNFKVNTYINSFIQNYRKTFLIFDGCPSNLGCTLVIRGEDIVQLTKIKQILDFLVFVVYNLKLESFLFRDEFALAPITEHEDLLTYEPSKIDDVSADKISNEKESFLSQALKPYETLILSASPFVKFPPPFLLLRAIEEEKNFSKKLKCNNSGLNLDKEELQTETQSSFTGYNNLENFSLETRAGLRHLLDDEEGISPFGHQNLKVLYSNVNKLTNIPCQPPELHSLEYYRANDLTLGQFLEVDLCCNASLTCSSKICGEPLFNHFRSYAHNNGRITVSIEECPPAYNGMEGKILMWSVCKYCKISTPIILMSDESWKYSFAKYIEITFYHNFLSCRANICPHDIHRDHFRYFGLSNLALKFAYETIDLVEISVPPLKLKVNFDHNIKLKVKDMEDLKFRIDAYYESIYKRIEMICDSTNGPLLLLLPNEAATCSVLLSEMQKRAELEQKYLNQLLQQCSISSLATDTLAINSVKALLPEKVLHWDLEFSNFVKAHLQFDPTRELRKLVNSSVHIRKIFDKEGTNRFLMGDTNPYNARNNKELEMKFPKLGDSPKSDSNLKVTAAEQKRDKDSVISPVSNYFFQDTFGLSNSQLNLIKLNNRKIFSELEFPLNLNEFRILDDQKSNHFSLMVVEEENSNVEEIHLNLNLKNRFTDLNPNYYYDHTSLKANESTSTINNRIKLDFEAKPELSIFNEENSRISNESSRYFSDNDFVDLLDNSINAENSFEYSAANNSNIPKVQSNSNLSGLASSEKANPSLNLKKNVEKKPSAELNNSINGVINIGEKLEKIKENYEDEDEEEKILELSNSSKPIGIGSFSSLGSENEKKRVFRATASIADSNSTKPADNVIDRSSIVKSIISNFWTGNSVNLDPLESPILPVEHIFPDSNIVVREDEPGSIIAFTLNSKEYLAKLQSMHEYMTNLEKNGGLNESDPALSEGVEMELYSIPQAAAGDNASTTMGGRLSNSSDARSFNGPYMGQEDTLLRGAGTHIKYRNFEKNFDALRRNCGCDETFVESLTRCQAWQAMGGKSGSSFLKTRDDRLVLKELSKLEMDAFLKFAPVYFEYMSQALFHELPTVLAKIFGVYRIGFKNSVTGNSLKLDVLVMENLFYERKISRIFDLKGSIRNRHVQSTGKLNEVLMDVNLVELIYESPLFIREHSKRLLRASVWNDTLFLSKLNVMDYSLLVGIDEKNHELVVGIVDFIRTYTWDKKIESWVKESNILGGGKEPTIVSPRIYKNRFREAMEKYFLMVPDKFTGTSNPSHVSK
ncbi:1-phosphatidylinositol-3-phosphate 5-kinase [Clydaea vesicula]|uniref:1-phosphatidylinositol-3-phosphate 5-kinase n=1 Tax=Clydaea vesicula TaxID=447962 RepID=A0AAD5U6T1_9FUNG|nr:1-phosphatidylinositol-3-phosphate 5-kinase [Clydaea vesicula]